MKVIKVESCGNCPLKGSNYNMVATEFTREYFCAHTETEGMEIENTQIIHPDCPLEDYKKGD